MSKDWKADVKADVAAARKNWQTVALMRTGFASSPGRLGASLLAVMLCAVLAQPARALTSNTRFTSAVAVTKETAYRGVFEGGAEAHTGLFCQADPVDNTDPTGMFTQSEGYAAEEAIQAVYKADHPNDDVIYGQWTRLGSLTGNLFRLKPDILNNTAPKRWAEIKPFTTSGVVKAGLQYAKYQGLRIYGYKPDTGWTPSKHYAVIGDWPIMFWNCEGIIFYTDASDQAEDLFALSTYALAKQYLLENGASFATREVLVPALVRITQIVRITLPAIELDEAIPGP